MTLTTPTLPTTAATPVTHFELERAWRALQAGVFRERSDVAPEELADHLADHRPLASGAVFAGPVVVVAGCHGWAGTSTAALVLAEGYARRGVPVRLLDAAAAARSGLAGAAVTEHGLDQSGRWRCGSRGEVAVHRIAGSLAGVVDVPEPPVMAEGTVTVVDAGWPIPDLLAGVGGHWLPSLLQEAPLLLTAQANVPGLRHAEVTLE